MKYILFSFKTRRIFFQLLKVVICVNVLILVQGMFTLTTISATKEKCEINKNDTQYRYLL